MSLFDSFLAASRGAATAYYLEHILGDFRTGRWADFKILDIDFFAELNKDSDNENVTLLAKLIKTFQSGIEVARDGKMIHE